MHSDAEWYEAMKAKGHLPIMAEWGGLDTFVTDAGYHNGPGCSICDWSCCMHCDGLDEIPECAVMTLECVEITDIKLIG